MTLKELHTAGADSFNLGKPCVPGLDPIWHLAISGPSHGPQSIRAKAFAQVWRTGWRSQAALVERVTERCPYSFNEYNFPDNYECLYVKGHDGVCSL